MLLTLKQIQKYHTMSSQKVVKHCRFSSLLFYHDNILPDEVEKLHFCMQKGIHKLSFLR